jgi:hypothetical protein
MNKKPTGAKTKVKKITTPKAPGNAIIPSNTFHETFPCYFRISRKEKILKGVSLFVRNIVILISNDIN